MQQNFPHANKLVMESYLLNNGFNLVLPDSILNSTHYPDNGSLFPPQKSNRRLSLTLRNNYSLIINLVNELIGMIHAPLNSTSQIGCLIKLSPAETASLIQHSQIKCCIPY